MTKPVPTNNPNNPTAAFDKVFNMPKKRTPKQQAAALLQSWAKVAVAGSLACYLAGSRDWTVILDAGVAAVLPVIYNWFDPSDKRYGRSK